MLDNYDRYDIQVAKRCNKYIDNYFISLRQGHVNYIKLNWIKYLVQHALDLNDKINDNTNIIYL